jgi:hypothetical protein
MKMKEKGVAIASADERRYAIEDAAVNGGDKRNSI